MFRFPSVICIRCTGFFYLAIIKGPPNDIYCIIEEPYKHYFTEKVSYSHKKRIKAGDKNTHRPLLLYYPFPISSRICLFHYAFLKALV